MTGLRAGPIRAAAVAAAAAALVVALAVGAFQGEVDQEAAAPRADRERPL
jgi:hypothetical protein